MADPHGSPPPGRQNRFLTALAPAAAWLTGILLFFGPALGSGFRRVLGGLGDVRLVNFTLEHGYRWLLRDPLHLDFWSPPIFYPQPGVSAYTDVLLGVAPVYWLVRALGAEPDVAFQLWVLAMWTLNFVAAHWLLRRWLGLRAWASAAGAFLFAFGSWRGRNVMHQQLMPSFYLVLAVIALVALFGRPEQERPRGWSPLWVGVFFAAVVLQFYTAFYPAYFLGLALAVALVAALVRRGLRRRLWEHLRRRWAVWLVGAALAAAALAPLASRYAGAAEEVRLRDFSQARLPRPASWVLMGQTNLVYGALQRPGGPFRELRSPNFSAGLGPVTTVVALVGLWRLRRRPGVQLLAISAVALAVVATQLPGGFSLWTAMRALPGAAAMRAVGRISLLLVLPAAVGVAAVFDRPARGRRLAGLVLLAALCFVEQLHRLEWRDRDELRERVAGIAAAVPLECEAFFLVSRGPRRYKNADDDAAWAALAAGIPTVNGRYSNYPPRWKLHDSFIRKPRHERRLRRDLDLWVRIHRLDPERICWVETERLD